MSSERRGWWLFGFSIIVYLLVRLVGLTQFPIYLFTDEAVQTVRAEQLWQNQLRSSEGELLPTFFKNGAVYNLSLSVYAQLVPWLIWGKSVGVTRGVSVLISSLLPIAVALALKLIYKSRWWWSSVLLVSLIPTWFLHSRTAFEVVMCVSFYATAVLGYLIYRCINPRWLWLAILNGAMAFYSYSPGQAVVGTTVLLLGLVDIRYHWRWRRIVIPGLLLAGCLALPYFRFMNNHQQARRDHLRTLSSYWVEPISLTKKAGYFAHEYINGLSPEFWFSPTAEGLDRHKMKNYGYMGYIFLPLIAIGLGMGIVNWKKAAYRTVLVILLAVPVGGAVAAVSITRNMVTIVPLALLGGWGLDRILEGWRKKVHQKGRFDRLITGGLWVGLIIINGLMVREVILKAPQWYQDYGLYGMQWGAKQVFSGAKEYVRDHPQAQVLVSPSWSNGTGELLTYFIEPGIPVRLESIDGFLHYYKPMDESMVFVATPEEYDRVINSSKFENVVLEKVINYPNGKPGFYFLKLKYVEGVEEIFALEKEARRQLIEAKVPINSQEVLVRHSRLDMGTIDQAFDGNANTLVRGLEANPWAVEMMWPKLQTASGVKVITGSALIKLKIQLENETLDEPFVYEMTVKGSVSQPEHVINWGEAVAFTKARLELSEPGGIEPAHIHVWEIEMK